MFLRWKRMENKMRKKIKTLVVVVLVICLSSGLVACGGSDDKWLSSADEATTGDHFDMLDNMVWGLHMDEVQKELTDAEFETDTETYISAWTTGALPTDDKWEKDSGSVNPKSFKESEMLTFYAFNQSSALIEYGYQYFDANLYQYDFLKEYYTKKYGKPVKEEFIWNSKGYEPDGKEDYYKLFAEGKVKVEAVWDIKDKDTALVVDWLNDPTKAKNNFGQITFFENTGELNLDVDEEDTVTSEAIE